MPRTEESREKRTNLSEVGAWAASPVITASHARHLLKLTDNRIFAVLNSVKAFFSSVIILASAMPVCSVAQQQQPQLVDYELKLKGSDFCVSLNTGFDMAGEDVAWLLPYLYSSKRPMFHTRTAKEVTDAFLNQPISTQKNGIRMQSFFYLVPNSEAMRLGVVLRRLSNNAAYRKSESDLVDQMRTQCEGLGIALFVNTSNDWTKPWRLLTDEKTIKNMNNIKPVKRTRP
jgi:hypothetical protein